MSDVHTHHEHDGPHEGPIKTPQQLIKAVIFAFVVPIVVILLLAVYVVEENRPAAGSTGLSAASIDARLRPVGIVEVKDLTDPASMKTGLQVYTAQCAACHTTGAAGAPKLGDAAAWGPRVGKGYDELLHAALKGKGAMGPQGGGDFSDYEIGRAVVYIANQGGGSLPEPTFQAPGAANSAAVAPATAAATAAPAGAASGAQDAAASAAANAATALAAAKPADAGAGAKVDAATAPALYAQACAVCHVAGVAGAPKLGDKAAWAPRVSAGLDALVASVIKGKGAMPPRGGSQASDAEIRETVKYMVDTVK